MDKAFNQAFERVIGSEGCFTDDPKDRGNWTVGIVGKGELKGTKYGISAMSYPHEDIRNLTLDRAKELYYRDYWQKLNLDEFIPELSYQIFDAAVQHGNATAAKFLQQVVGTIPDGILGKSTVSKAKSMNQRKLVFFYIANRLRFYTKIGTFSVYGKGWVNRMAVNISYAAEMEAV